VNNGNIPFLDLITPHVEMEAELTDVFRSALQTAGFIGGPKVEDFEQDFAKFCEARFCVGVSSGTDALRFALMAAGIGRGDVVVTVPHTFIATVEAITQSGAEVAFVDVDEQTSNMDPEKLREYLQEKCTQDAVTGQLIDSRKGMPVRAVVPVHLYGQMADMDPILDLCERYGLTLIEDACQAHGAEYFSHRQNAWRKAGSIGKAAAFSFYPGKNLGACGEAGAVTTNDEHIAQKIKMLRDHGQAKKYYHDVEGYNGRLDAIQAGILHRKLKHLNRWNQQRRECADVYKRVLAPLAEEMVLPVQSERSVYHLYVVRHLRREALQTHLAGQGIGTAIHYPIPLHLQNAYRDLGYRSGDFPVSEKLASEILSLPMYPNLKLDQQERIAESISKFVSQQAVLTP
jgi:dTDP-4-amino-4,6-dideoxygalactose transaminase